MQDGETVVQDEASQCCDDSSTLHFRQQLHTPAVCLSLARDRPEQQSWTRRTYVSVLPFLLPPFGLLQDRFHLHPAMYKVKVREENTKTKRKGGDVGRKLHILMTLKLQQQDRNDVNIVREKG